MQLKEINPNIVKLKLPSWWLSQSILSKLIFWALTVWRQKIKGIEIQFHVFRTGYLPRSPVWHTENRFVFCVPEESVKKNFIFFWSHQDKFMVSFLCNLLTSLSASNVMRKHQKRQCFYWLLLTLWGYWFIALEKCLWEFHWPICQLYFQVFTVLFSGYFSSHSLPLMLWMVSQRLQFSGLVWRNVSACA